MISEVKITTNILEYSRISEYDTRPHKIMREHKILKLIDLNHTNILLLVSSSHPLLISEVVLRIYTICILAWKQNQFSFYFKKHNLFSPFEASWEKCREQT